MIEKRRSLELKKHVGAIHSANSMTLVQRKIANGLLYNAYEKLMEQDEHKISIKDLCMLIGYDSNDYKTIKTALVNLLSTVIEWNLVDRNSIDKEGIWNASSIIADASITGSLCTYSYSNRMKQLLYRPEIYGRLNMAIQAKFKSGYGLALYENCIRYQNLEYTPWIDFIIFRRLMGVEEGTYPIFRDFKRRVLDKAVAEVNHHAPIKITPNLRKNSRKVIAIRFLISQAKTQQLANKEIAAAENIRMQLKTDFGLSTRFVDELIMKYDQAYIVEKMTMIETSPSFLQGKIINLAKYLTDALEKDYKPPKSSKDRRGEGREEILLQNKIQPQQKEKLQNEYERLVSKDLLAKFQQLLPNEQNKLFKEFELYLGNGGYLDIFRRTGLKNTIVADMFCVFIKTTLPNFYSPKTSFEEFVKHKAVENSVTPERT